MSVIRVIERSRLRDMDRMEKLLEALGEYGEAACFYRGQKFLVVNERFAELFERSKEEFVDLPIIEVVHNESIEMIQDFMRRRAHANTDVPTTYEAQFKTKSNPKVTLKVIALKLKESERAVLAILRKK